METAEYDLMYRIESDYWWYVGRRWLVVRLLRRWLGETRPLEILDIGCGTGANLQALKQFGNTTGSDVSLAAVQYCHSRGLVEVVQQTDANRLPFDSGRFDLVTCLDVIEHIEDDLGMMREVARVLKPGGASLFTTPAHPVLWSVHDESLHHKRRYRRAEFLEKLHDAGLVPQRITYLNGLLLPLIVPVRWLRDRLTRQRGTTSDFNLHLPRWLNAAFRLTFCSEWGLLKFAPLPFGLSLCCLARRD